MKWLIQWMGSPLGWGWVAGMLAALATHGVEAAILSPGDTVPNTSGDVFTWSIGASGSTSASWETFEPTGGSFPGGIGPGQTSDADAAFSTLAAAHVLTFDSFATVISSGNAYGFNFGDSAPFQPAFIHDAFLTIRPETLAGGFTRAVVQWQTLGTELLPDEFLLSNDPGSAGTVSPDLIVETERGGSGSSFGGALVSGLAIWDNLDAGIGEYRVDFLAAGNHSSLDAIRIDTFTAATPFPPVVAVPEPSTALALVFATTTSVVTRRRRR